VTLGSLFGNRRRPNRAVSPAANTYPPNAVTGESQVAILLLLSVSC
jgi:hypothetical protein